MTSFGPWRRPFPITTCLTAVSRVRLHRHRRGLAGEAQSHLGRGGRLSARRADCRSRGHAARHRRSRLARDHHGIDSHSDRSRDGHSGPQSMTFLLESTFWISLLAAGVRIQTLPSIEDVWLRCRGNELQISHEENPLTLSKKNAALHLIAIDQEAQCFSLQRRAQSCVCAAACGKIAHIFP